MHNILMRSLALLLCKFPMKCHSISSGSCISFTEPKYRQLEKKKKKTKSHNNRKEKSNRRIERTNLRSFLDEFLDVVLAEAAVAGIVDLADDGDRLRLADGDNPDLLGRAARSLGGLVDALQHRPQRRRSSAVHGG